ncbi:MAG: phosphoribosylamine--glycine ligase [Actinomycetota bacterium]|nr:phosphoribosylamine--glycine ligase [Actinomycetota bacterium]
MKILVVGGGGREHALASALSNSPLVSSLVAAPGNPGIARVAECVSIAADDIEGLVAVAEERGVDLIVVGPEVPLVAGLADELRARGRAVFGPGRDAARIEGSKVWAKDLMVRAGIPTARAATFSSIEPAAAFVDELGGRAVVKADGLTAGKGVTVAADREQAVAALRGCLDARAFGDAGATVLVEELLQGPEISAFAICDGTSVIPLSLSQDFKRAGNGDTGPNTGGMGAYSPLSWVGEGVERQIWSIARQTVAVMAAGGIVFQGLLYVGLMLTDDGPEVLEYNCRFGDPETEAVIPRLGSDLAELLYAAATGSLGDRAAAWNPDACVSVVLASGGYPGAYETGFAIEGLEDAAGVDGVEVFHAGTIERDGKVVTAGGRVLAVSALASTMAEARARAYEACDRISFQGKRYRMDIAAHAAADEEVARVAGHTLKATPE